MTRKILHTGKKILWTFLLSVALLTINQSTRASHFRSMNFSWSQGVNDTIIFNITMSWRWSAFGNPALNTNVNVSSFTFGDGTSSNISLLVNSINASEDWFSGITTIKKKYAASGTYTASYSDCCRIGGLQNGNSGYGQGARTVVHVGNGNNPPVCLAPPIVNLPINVASTYILPGFDPDGNTYTFTITPTSISGLFTASPPGLTVSPSGVISWTPTTAGLYVVPVTVTDQHGASSSSDFLINVSTLSSNPPVFNYTSGNTPANNQVFTVNPGTNVSFNVVANDIDPGSTVTLSVVGLPGGGYTLTPTLPTTSNPVSTNFSWTPTGLQTGNYVLAFTATDNTSAQTTTNVIINVPAVSPPAFVVPPTPVGGSGSCIEVGTTRNDTIRASNTFSGANTRITSVNISGPVTGATLSPSVPTAYQPVASTVLSWTPSASEWQMSSRTVTAVATDANSLNTNHSFTYLINSVPVITSGAPPGIVHVGQPYSFTITATDADMAAGDTLDAHGSMLPSWVSVTKIGPGSFLVSGTPSCADVGHVHFEVGIEDIHHHCPGTHVDEHFHIDIEDTVKPVFTYVPSSFNVTTANPCGEVVNYNMPTATDNCASGSVGSQTFSHTGALQTFTVPAGVTSLRIVAKGASGGSATHPPGYPGGLGAQMEGDFAVTPGQVLNVIVGGKGQDEQYTSGGGGASGVGLGATTMIVAGGGAGIDYQDPSYVNRHAVITQNGNPGNETITGNNNNGGTGGSDGGDNIYSVNNISRGGRGWNSGNTGSFGQNGTSPNTVTTNGTFGIGGGGGSVGSGWCNCGAGGGGYSGGGAGNINRSGGGGGSFNAGTNQVNIGGTHSGNGSVVISWNSLLPTPVTQINGLPSGSTFPPGTTTNTFVADDGNGNTDTVSFTVTVTTTTSLGITCPGDITTYTDPNVCNAVVPYNPPVAATCGTCVGTSILSGYTYMGAYNGHNYFRSNAAVRPDTAFARALAAGGYVAIVNDSAENAFLAANISSGNHWIGFSDAVVEGTYVWQNNDPVTFTSWNTGEPNNMGDEDYAEIFPNGLWNDLPVNNARPFILELPCVTILQTTGLTSGSVFPSGVTTNTFVMYDPNGVSDTCSFNITVLDTVKPIIQCMNDTTIHTNLGICSADISPGNYVYSSIPHNPLPGVGTPVSLGDDVVSPFLNIGFSFKFYENTYTQFRISSNGFITFNNSTNSGCCSGQNIPNASTPNNLIAWCWTDLLPTPSGSPGHSIDYYTTGTAPYRKLVVNYTNVRFFGGGGNGNTQGQIVLHEGTNHIEIHLIQVTTNTRTITLGVENSNGTKATAVAGRNASNWYDSTQSYLFTPNIEPPLFSDNCSAVLTASPAGPLPVGVHTVTWTATDPSGNTSSCTQQITVEDHEDPVIVCPTAVNTYNADFAGCTLNSLPVLSVSDNCGIQSLVVSPAGPYAVGQHTVIWTATDIHGNTATCQQTFIVNPSPSTGSTTITQCDSYTWNSQTYTTSGTYTGTFANALGCDSVHTLYLTIPPGIYLNVGAWLAGAYDMAQGLMHDSLRVNNLIPVNEPYSPPSVYNINPVSIPGGESIGMGVLSTTGPGAIVDWMLVEVRQASNPLIVLANVRGLIRRDGVITGTDGVSALTIPSLYPGNYHVSVKHRNHLGVMTANPVFLSGCSPSNIDFRTTAPVYVKPGVNNPPRKAMGAAMTLWSADANFNKNVKYNGLQNDKDAILNVVGIPTPNNVVPGYRREDCNLDGKVMYNNTNNDRMLIIQNVGTSTPNTILNQHTPN